MRKWILAQLAHVARINLVVDAAGVVSDDEIVNRFGSNASCAYVTDWLALRRAWERDGRQRPATAPDLVIVIADPSVTKASDLPWDIEQASSVSVVNAPGPPDVQSAILELDDERADQAVALLETRPKEPRLAVLAAAAGDVPPTTSRGEFNLALQLRRANSGPAILLLAMSSLTDPLARAVCETPARWADVQGAWEEWLRQPEESPWRFHMQHARAHLIDLFLDGTLSPVSRPPHGQAPPWASVGQSDMPSGERLRNLLEEIPQAHPSTIDEWARVATWWGQVRLTMAQHHEHDDLHTAAWDTWHALDEQFLNWLDTSYGSQLSRTWLNGPPTLDKVQHYLASTTADGERILVIILDGMGFAQWAQIRDAIRASIKTARAVLAMLPTLTEVSRQAIAAGAPPIQYADSLRSTHREARHWKRSWAERTTSCSWRRIDGIQESELDGVPLGSVDVIGLVISAVDELMHTNELLGDTGMHASLQAWLRNSTLATLIDRAFSHDYRVWITADHGNLECMPVSEPREGQFTERAGTRVRRYASKTLRDSSEVEGIRRDSLPGYPREFAECLLFAPGRTGWGKARLSHGGLSFDEVIVPFVELERP